MQRSKILGVVLMAAFVLSAVVSATASAAVTVLPALAADEMWTGSSGAGTLEVLKNVLTVICKKDVSEGTIEKDKPLGKFHIDFLECKTGLLVACTGLGEKKEEILVLGTYHLVFDTLGAVLKDAGIGVLFLVDPVHFECGAVLVVVEGQVLCLIKPVNEKVKHFEIVCKKGVNTGDPGETVYWDGSGKEVKMGEELLLTKENEGAGMMSGENATALILTLKEIELMT